MNDIRLNEAIEMYESVRKYGGFYIGRYEAGGSELDKTTNFGRGDMSVTMAKAPYNGVPWTIELSMDRDNGGAVELSRKFYPKSNLKYGVVSTLTYGVQWDTTLSWIKSVKGEDFDLLDSTQYGNYENTIKSIQDFNKNSKYARAIWNASVSGFYDVGPWKKSTEFTTSGTYMMTTGALKFANVCNIYDMAGNMFEWTMEGYSTWGRARRGGCFGSNRLGLFDSR